MSKISVRNEAVAGAPTSRNRKLGTLSTAWPLSGTSDLIFPPRDVRADFQITLLPGRDRNHIFATEPHIVSPVSLRSDASNEDQAEASCRTTARIVSWPKPKSAARARGLFDAASERI